MKKALITLGVLLCAATVFAQGQIEFNTRILGMVMAPVYMPQLDDPSLQLHGQSAAGVPAGTTGYTGGPIPAAIGPNFTAQLFGGPLGTADASLVPCFPSTTFRTQTALAGFVVAPPTPVTLPGVPPGFQARLQLRVWDNRGGTITSWADALQAAADGTLMLGDSLAFDSLPLGGGTTLSPILIGLTSFNLTVPEPSVIALGVLGFAGLLLLRRRRR